MSEKRTKMLTLWVTEDEHRRLLERCDGKQLAAWMRQTCLDEKPARAGKLPTLAPALLRHALESAGGALERATESFEPLVQRHEYEVAAAHEQRQKELTKEREYPGPSLEL